MTATRGMAFAMLIPLAGLAGCTADARSATRPPKVRVGYFLNLTHAPAIVGVERRFFADALGDKGRFEAKSFNAGPEVVQALFSKALDIAYIGPNPAINAFAQSGGDAIRIVAGAVSGGAALVVKPEITSPEQLRGATLATPQLGNTQDVALRWWLQEHGLSTTITGGGDVKIMPQPNAQTLETFRSGDVDGAWVPEPWASRLVLEGMGRQLVDERSLWPEGRFVATHVIVRTAFLGNHPDLVAAFLRGHLAAIEFLNTRPAEAQAVINGALQRITGKALSTPVMTRAWESLAFTVDPVAPSLRASAAHARRVGLLEPVNLDGIYAIRILNDLLSAQGEPRMAA